MFFQLKQSVVLGKTLAIVFSIAPVIVFCEFFVFDFCFYSVFLEDFCEYLLVGWKKRFLASVKLIVFCSSVFYKEFLFYFRGFFVRNIVKNIFCSPGKLYFLVCPKIRTIEENEEIEEAEEIEEINSLEKEADSKHKCQYHFLLIACSKFALGN